MDTEPDVDSSTSRITVPLLIPCLESEVGNVAEPWRSRRGVPSSSFVLKWVLTAGVVLAVGVTDWGLDGNGAGEMGSCSGGASVKKFSTGAVISIGTRASGMGTRVGSGMELTSVNAGGGGGASGGGSSNGGGGGGWKMAVSTSRTVRSAVSGWTVNKRAIPRTANRIAEAAMPMMVDRKFKIQGSSFKKDICL